MHVQFNLHKLNNYLAGIVVILSIFLLLVEVSTIFSQAKEVTITDQDVIFYVKKSDINFDKHKNNQELKLLAEKLNTSADY